MLSTASCSLRRKYFGNIIFERNNRMAYKFPMFFLEVDFNVREISFLYRVMFRRENKLILCG